jgi:predicted TPR repeat methyltransferase
VCGDSSGEPLLHAPSYPSYLLPLPIESAGAVLRADLTAWACRGCGHLQQCAPDPVVQDAIYANYYDHYRMDSVETQVPIYRRPFETFVETHAADLPRGTWLEIGCSNGERVSFFAQFADRYVGIDPSRRIETARARHPGHEFISGRFPEAAGNLAFDVAVSQFLLEHIVDIGSFLDAARARARPRGTLIVQVPDVEEYARRDQPNFLAHEHVHYFRRVQLESVLRRHGWRPVAWGPSGPSLIVAACCDRPALAPPPEPAARDWACARALFDAPVALPDGPLLFYGVGPLLFWLLARGAPAGRVRVVDDNPSYQGMAVPGFGWPIERLDAEIPADAGTVILSLNPIYHRAVLQRLAALGCEARVLAWSGRTWRQAALDARPTG